MVDKVFSIWTTISFDQKKLTFHFVKVYNTLPNFPSFPFRVLIDLSKIKPRQEICLLGETLNVIYIL
jgi:hypothetical protein